MGWDVRIWEVCINSIRAYAKWYCTVVNTTVGEAKQSWWVCRGSSCCHLLMDRILDCIRESGWYLAWFQSPDYWREHSEETITWQAWNTEKGRSWRVRKLWTRSKGYKAPSTLPDFYGNKTSDRRGSGGRMYDGVDGLRTPNTMLDRTSGRPGERAPQTTFWLFSFQWFCGLRRVVWRNGLVGQIYAYIHIWI